MIIMIIIIIIINIITNVVITGTFYRILYLMI